MAGWGATVMRHLSPDEYVTAAIRNVVDGLRVSDIARTRAAIAALFERHLTEGWNAAVERVAERVSKTTFRVPIGYHGSPSFSGEDLDAAAFVRIARRPHAPPLQACPVCGAMACLGSDGLGCPSRQSLDHIERRRGN